MIAKYEVRQGTYYDSIILMQLQKSLSQLDGVTDAAVVMATEANKSLLRSTGFESIDEATAHADDLVIVIKGESDGAASEALAQVDSLLTQRKARGGGGQFRPKSLKTAAQMLPSAEWVLISVPGRYAASVVEEALDLNKHVFLYSDNVSADDETRLKKTARAKGLLLMGPDCGTAIINGIGLGFANRVRQGSIGVVAASGTGLQAVTSHIHELGAGISQAFGTGGRDLKDSVGGITALQALEYLKQDNATDRIVLISKPPSPDVAAQLLASAFAADKPVIIYMLGYAPGVSQLKNLHFVQSLTDAARAAVSVGPTPPSNSLSVVTGCLRGLFSGGTLAYAVLLGLQSLVVPIYSNLEVGYANILENVHRSQGHTIVDLGEDEFTQGRLHPMMDNALRLRRLHEEADDEDVGLILLDVVLGEGAHSDPAAELVPSIEAVNRQRPDLTVAILVVGTADDPQDKAAQIGRFEKAGCLVFTDIQKCVETIASLIVQPPHNAYPPIRFNTTLTAINIGLESFHDSATAQGAEVIHVEWKPPAGGNEKMMALLAKLKQAQSG